MAPHCTIELGQPWDIAWSCWSHHLFHSSRNKCQTGNFTVLKPYANESDDQMFLLNATSLSHRAQLRLHIAGKTGDAQASKQVQKLVLSDALLTCWHLLTVDCLWLQKAVLKQFYPHATSPFILPNCFHSCTCLLLCVAFSYISTFSLNMNMVSNNLLRSSDFDQHFWLTPRAFQFPHHSLSVST